MIGEQKVSVAAKSCQSRRAVTGAWPVIQLCDQISIRQLWQQSMGCPSEQENNIKIMATAIVLAYFQVSCFAHNKVNIIIKVEAAGIYSLLKNILNFSTLCFIYWLQ